MKKHGPKGLSVGTFGFAIVGELDASPPGMSLDELYGRLVKSLPSELFPSTRRKMERLLWDQKLFGYVERVPGKLRFWRVTEAGKQAVKVACQRFDDEGPFMWDHQRNLPVRLPPKRDKIQGED